MATEPDALPQDWDLDDWKRSLTISVGQAYACRTCGNVVMVTRGGVGVMELVCCGSPMEKLQTQSNGGVR
jgi:desulfoferrodoxin-like iron-binding protein